MRRLALLLVAVCAVTLGVALMARAGSDAHAGFRTPDAGAACKLSGPSLVCSSLGSPGSVALRSSGARVVDRLPWWDASTPVLRDWHHGATSCRLAGNTILCRNDAATIRVTAAGFAARVRN
jgi:hypothetical protein